MSAIFVAGRGARPISDSSEEDVKSEFEGGCGTLTTSGASGSNSASWSLSRLILPKTGKGSLRSNPSADISVGCGSLNDTTLSSSENETRAFRLR